MTTMNISDYANHAGVNRKTITRWMNTGKYIVKAGDDIDVEASDKNLKKYRDSKDPRAKNATKKSETPQEKPIKEKGDFQQRAESVYAGLVSGEVKVRDLEESKAIKEHYFAELARLEYEEKSGLVLPWQDMIDKIGEEYHAMRTRLIAIAPEHGPRLRSLALTSSDAEFVAAVQDIIHEAMEELSLDHSEQGG